MTDAPLPATLAEIARIIGRDAALKVALKYGGGRLSIPRKPRKGGDLEATIGTDAAGKLCKAYPGDRLLIPLAKRPLIFWLRDQDKSVRDIALALKTSERTVYTTLSPEGAESVQGDLFKSKAG